MKTLIRTLAIAAFFAVGPVSVASASIITFEISGAIDCSNGSAERGYCWNPEGIAAATGFPIFYHRDGRWNVSGPFTMTLSIDTDASPSSTAAGQVRMGDLSFIAEATVGEAATSGCDGWMIYIRASNLDLFGTTLLCSSAVLVDDWQDVAALTDAELNSFGSGFAEYDKYLVGSSTAPRWSGIWEARFIDRIPEPPALALLGFGLAGLAFTWRRKH